MHQECYSISFLDLKFFIDKDIILAKSFRKSNAGNTVLHSKSCHPPHISRNVAYGEMIIARRNCSNIADFMAESMMIQKRLHARGYLIYGWWNRHNKEPWIETDLACYKKDVSNRTQGTRVDPLYSLPHIVQNIRKSVVKKYMPMLENYMGTETALKDGYLCVARRAPTLGQELSPSLFNDNISSKPTWLQYKGSYPCGHKICICCTVMSVGSC